MNISPVPMTKLEELLPIPIGSEIIYKSLNR